MRDAVIIEQADNNFSAYVPDLSGCVATGPLVAETEKLIREGIELHLADLKEDGVAPCDGTEFRPCGCRTPGIPHGESVSREDDALLTALVVSLTERVPGLLGVWLFGTWGTEHERPESDIDLAVLAERPLTLEERLSALEGLAAVTDRAVDLVDLTRNDAVIRAQAVAPGRRLYCRDADRCDRFEDFVYADYARLNEERGAILRDVGTRGRIHA